MSLRELTPAGQEEGVRARIYAELERHGFPPPGPYPLQFRSPLFTPEATRQALAVEMVGASAVAVSHGGEPTAEESRLLAETLPELARTHDAVSPALTEPGFTSFIFERPDGARNAAAFLAAVKKVLPPHWRVTEGVLPPRPEASTGTSTGTPAANTSDT